MNIPTTNLCFHYQSELRVQNNKFLNICQTFGDKKHLSWISHTCSEAFMWEGLSCTDKTATTMCPGLSSLLTWMGGSGHRQCRGLQSSSWHLLGAYMSYMARSCRLPLQHKESNCWCGKGKANEWNSVARENFQDKHLSDYPKLHGTCAQILQPKSPRTT